MYFKAVSYSIIFSSPLCPTNDSDFSRFYLLLFNLDNHKNLNCMEFFNLFIGFQNNIPDSTFICFCSTASL